MPVQQPPDVESIVDTLRALGTQRVRDDMRDRYGVTGKTAEAAFGVGMAAMQKVAKGIRTKDAGQNHALALALWETGHYEARMVASLMDEPTLVNKAQMDKWSKGFDSWAIVDTVCFKLFDQVSPELALDRVDAWARNDDEFIKRASVALLACLALHNTDVSERELLARFPLVEKIAGDNRNFVKKGVSWALRAMAGRSPKLRAAVTTLSRQLAESENATERWIARDVLKAISK